MDYAEPLFWPQRYGICIHSRGFCLSQILKEERMQRQNNFQVRNKKVHTKKKKKKRKGGRGGSPKDTVENVRKDINRDVIVWKILSEWEKNPHTMRMILRKIGDLEEIVYLGLDSNRIKRHQ